MQTVIEGWTPPFGYGCFQFRTVQIMLRTRNLQWKDLASARAVLWVWAPIVLISLLHYSTGATHHWAHDIFRRLYYMPIILAAFAFGTRGALAASVAASLIYSPHAFTHFALHDPAHGTEKMLEIILYNVIALVAGQLADREFHERKKQEATATKLAQTLDEKNEMEAMLIRAGKLQALGELTAGLAHEIKNPLASIQGAAEAVIDEVAPDSPRQKMAAILMKELKRLEGILDRFLSFARTETYDLTQVLLDRQIEHVMELMQSQAGQLNASIRIAPSSQSVSVLGQTEKILQVLMNLVLNALQASPPGGEVSLSCTAVTRNRKSFGCFVVEDQGPGVPEDLKEKIFNPFFTTRDAGSGLGLAIAAKIVDQHQGFIEFANRPEGGARFFVFFPAVN